MQVTIDPPMHTWKPRVPDLALIARRRAMGFNSPEKPIIATGHQAGFWHPGILAKCIATVEFAKKVGAQPLYVLVDQDANDALKLELPFLEGGRLVSRDLHLADLVPDVAIVAQPQHDWFSPAMTRLTQANRQSPHADLGPFLKLRINAPDLTFAHEMAQLMAQLWRPSLGELPVWNATDLMDPHLVQRMLRDARQCVHHYNDGVGRHAEAGVPPLIVERDRVELPLWFVGNPWPRGEPAMATTGEPRRRVFVDLADSVPILVLEDGSEVPSVKPPEKSNDALERIYIGLAPRALTLTAMLRSTCCDLFIHGRGGGVYDRAMEMWWHNWTGEPLAPMAVVTADVRLDFPGVPVAQAKEVDRAVWYAHHLPHNLDRHLPREAVNQPLAGRKHELLDHMNDDRDRKRRAASFREIHDINRRLREQQADIIMLAKQQVERAKLGAANRAVAMKRDWSFALYPKEKLEELRATIARLAVGL